MKVRVSIIIPTYNREKFILRALQSAINQTFQDFEVLIIDDASTDNTYKTVLSLKNEKIRYFKLDNNVGQCVARNYGIGKSSGEYIAFLDSDDEWLPTKLEKQIKLLDSDNKIGAVYCSSYNTDDRTGIMDLIKSDKYKRGNISFDLLSGLCPPTPSLFVVKSEIIKEAGMFDEKLITFVDVDLWLRIAQKCEFDFVNEPLAIKHDHSEDQYISNFNKRNKGLLLFTNKWESHIVSAVGVKKYRKLRSHFVETILIPVLQIPPDDYRTKFRRILSLFLIYERSFRSFKLIIKSIIIYLLGPHYYKRVRSIMVGKSYLKMN
jgi:glycosyltransferase involved in cell wall biosynthesis